MLGRIGGTSFDELDLRPVQDAGRGARRIVRNTPIAALGANVLGLEGKRRRRERPLRPLRRVGIDPLAARKGPVMAQVAPDLAACPRHALNGLVKASGSIEIQQPCEIQRRDRRELDLGLRLLVRPR